MNNKLFVVRKYIWAKSAKDAIKKEKNHPVEDVWVDDKWKENSSNPKDAVGFYIDNSEEE